MQLIDGAAVYSATDLVGFLACEHLTALERAALRGLVERPNRLDPELEIIRRRGREHEARYLAERCGEGRSVVTIDPDGYEAEAGDRLRAAAAATERAMSERRRMSSTRQHSPMAAGAAMQTSWCVSIHLTARATGGPYHYEIVDTKLARHVKAGAVLQVCTYVDLLTAMQDVQTEFMHIALGGSARTIEKLRVDDYMAYYRAVKARFEAAVGPGAPQPSYPPPLTYPEPVEHCEVCRWSVDCEARRRADDHTSLVADGTRRQRTALTARGSDDARGAG